MFLVEVKQSSVVLPSCKLSSKCPFHGLFSAVFFAFLHSFLGFHRLKCPPNVVLKCYLVFLSTKKAVICFIEENSVLDKFHSAMSCSTVGCEFRVSESRIYIK